MLSCRRADGACTFPCVRAPLLHGCTGGVDRPSDSALPDSVASASADSSVDTSAAGTAGASALPHLALDSPLPPLADTIAQRLVFYTMTQNWFVGATRGKRLLIDLGRVDMEVRKDSARSRAYREAVAARSPVPIGTRLRLRGQWGEDDAIVSGFDTWNGRIAATVTTAPSIEHSSPCRIPWCDRARGPQQSAASE